MKKNQGKSLNYNFDDQVEPNKRMGAGEFANLPSEPKYLNFKNKPQYRGGVVNSLTLDLAEDTGMYENQRGK